MPDLAAIVQTASLHAWLYLPVAVLLGALHALEPGHAKSMMAAYIVAIRGSAGQAVTLALSAAVGHTIIVWGLAIAALLFGEQYIVVESEPWLTVVAGVFIVWLAIRMFAAIPGDRNHHHSHDHEGH